VTWPNESFQLGMHFGTTARNLFSSANRDLADQCAAAPLVCSRVGATPSCCNRPSASQLT
jgi:hypothetical protein